MEYKESYNKDFDIPYYIFEEMIEYIEQTAQGRCRCCKWENILKLMSCAVENNKLTETQYQYLKENYCRER